MAIFLLDTCVIVDAINGKRARNQLLDALITDQNLLACCSINVTEVYAGMRPHEASLTEPKKSCCPHWQAARELSGLRANPLLGVKCDV